MSIEAAHLAEKTDTASTGKKKISVLHLIYSPCYGGIESVVINWVSNIDRSLFNVHVAYFAGDRDREFPFLRAAKAAGIQPLPVPWSRFKPFLKAARAVAKIVRDLDIDIVHTHAYYGDAVGAIAGLLSPVKTMATVYIWGKYELHRQIMHVIDWTALQFIDKVTAHCRDTARKTFILGKRRRDIPVLPPGYADHNPPVPASRRKETRIASGIAEDEVLLLNAARLAPEKAQDQLLRSFRIIHDRFPETRLWIKGVGLEKVEHKLQMMIRELNLESCVSLGGFEEDFWTLLHTADIMVHPSHTEGIPLSIMGAMAAGLPIVVSDVGGIAEVVEHGRSGMLVPENDETGFANTVIKLLEDRDFAASLGKAAKQAVANEHSIQSAIRKVEQVYCEIMEQ